MGRNVAAGMTGGLAYILDEDNTLLPKVCAFLLQFFTGNTMRLEACRVDFFLFFFSPAAIGSVSSYFIMCALSQLWNNCALTIWYLAPGKIKWSVENWNFNL